MPETATQNSISQTDRPEFSPVNSGKISNDGFIVSKIYDRIWFIGAPVIGFIVALIFIKSGAADIELDVEGSSRATIFELFLGTFILSHLFIVFFRSHANPEIFKLHPIRFIVVPVILIAAMTYSMLALITVTVICVWWDVYHSGQQTFGLGRIYDMRAGNSQQAGRRLDYFLNAVIYLGPILAGATLMDHVSGFEQFQTIGIYSLGKDLPMYIFDHKSTLTRIVLIIGIPFILYYLYAYWQLYKQGYVFSINKVILLVSTALLSIFCWGFNSFGEAFFVMNFYHAWQYFAIVWAFEKKNITNLFGLSGVKRGQYLSLFLFVFIALIFGLSVTVYEGSNTFLFSLILTVSVLHFWYDGFIWSVKKKQV